MRVSAEHGEIDAMVSTMADALARNSIIQRPQPPLLIGIHTGGVWIAERLHQRLGLQDPLGTLSIAFYRDDFSRIGMHPSVKTSDLPFDIESRHLILVDDILYTGRTVRAALNELFDYGRPTSVTLVALVDRGGRELPIQADVVGTSMSLDPEEQVKLSGPDRLRLVVDNALPDDLGRPDLRGIDDAI